MTARSSSSRPQPGCRPGRSFTVTVGYQGTPTVVTDPDGSIEGWVPTDDGAVSVGEPQGSPGWFPCNDNPQDKATFDFAITVPAGLTAMANGVLVSNATSGDTTTWVWHEADPMATYLATVDIGRFDLTTSTVDGIPSYVAVDPQLAKGQVLSKLPDIVRFYSSIYGPYPFTAVGAIVDSAKNLGYSLETQTKPLFPYVPERGDARPRAVAHVVRRLGDARPLARHLAARGLRHVVGVDLERVHGQQDARRSTSSSSTRPRPRTPPSGIRRRATRVTRRSSSTARSTTAAG